MNILVTGGTGTVGSQVVRELLSRGAQVQVLTRDPAKAAKLPAGVKAVTGDLMKVETVRRVFKGVDGVFLINAVSPTEVHEGLLSVCALRDENVKRLVYLSVHHADAVPWVPHFGGKLGIEQAVLKSGVPATVLRPNNFYQNDYMVQGCDPAARRLSATARRRRTAPRRRSRHRRGRGDRADDIGARRADLRSGRTGGAHGQIDGRSLVARARPPDRLWRERSRRVGEAIAAVHAGLGWSTTSGTCTSSSRRRG